MGKTINTVVCVIGAIICLGAALFYMPWSELGYSGDFPRWTNWILQPLGIPDIFKAQDAAGKEMRAKLDAAGAKTRDTQGDYGYSLYLALALVAGGIAVAAIGREEAEEKTIVPVKK